ncbi:Type IV pilus biogenesis protein PilE [Rubrivivax sp. A210]|uniref:type IV pilin protein n=1 Tax=Rubrivivax sp. A210 TaxID=2772301 RepID=UPI001917FCE0|nr:type IV pilin protein [Rubrivivax sp. A210]CAD5371839.1 Type IV pilus biogenesis protein PilE [Rubrivivax sp. A210]
MFFSASCPRGSAGLAVCRPARRAGFTLIELMIVVAVITVLMAVALPSYRAQILKSNRAQAQAYMQAVATRQQQFLVDTRGYAATLAAVGVSPPAGIASAYTLNLSVPDTLPPSFILTATPQGEQAGESCGTLSINSAGTKTAAGGGCW